MAERISPGWHHPFIPRDYSLIHPPYHPAGRLPLLSATGYSKHMNRLPEPVAGKMALLVGPRAEREAMLNIAALLALRGSVRVLDGGNSFNALWVARAIRRQTPHLAPALERIFVARAFTCYQVVTLFEQTPATETPQLVLDMLATFGDESVTVGESLRLLRIVVNHLRRLRQRGPVVVSIRPPPQPERQSLVRLLAEAADHVYARPETVHSPVKKLF